MWGETRVQEKEEEHPGNQEVKVSLFADDAETWWGSSGQLASDSKGAEEKVTFGLGLDQNG